MLTSQQLQQFNHDGFLVIKNFWPEELLTFWEKSLIALYLRQATKIESIKTIVADLAKKTDFSATDFDAILYQFEHGHKDAAYHVLKMIENSPAAHQLLSYSGLTKVAAALLKCPQHLLTLSGPNPFINLPSTKRLLYHWHSESCYYPKRRNFLNIWFPIFRDKTPDNGTMWFCVKSHEIQERHFIEYQGYDKETENKKNHFIQYEIPEVELTEYEKVPVIAQRGDLVCFHRSLVHTSTLNSSTTPSYASVLRVFDYGFDLTLSGEATVRPYSDNGGAPDLQPIRSELFTDYVI
jgi:ectoine hydroxylase-related dioxygenase (phytanoyl-CoA dioxygenase family)